jgi:hypothetical protein
MQSLKTFSVTALSTFIFCTLVLFLSSFVVIRTVEEILFEVPDALYQGALPSNLLLGYFNSIASSNIDQVELLWRMNKRRTQAHELLLPCLINGEVAV